ncbi:hypothetical protein NUACC21_65700 [Scytonema sp. NUACC21]
MCHIPGEFISWKSLTARLYQMLIDIDNDNNKNHIRLISDKNQKIFIYEKILVSIFTTVLDGDLLRKYKLTVSTKLSNINKIKFYGKCV